MPEGPEISIAADQLQSILAKKYIQSIQIIAGPYSSSALPIFVQTRKRIQALNKILASPTTAIRVDSIGKKGKFLYFRLSRLNRTTTPIVFGSSLGLTGAWQFHPAGMELPKYTKLAINFSDRPKSQHTTTLIYCDKLSNGKFYIDTPDWLDKKLTTIGPDVLSSDFTSTRFDSICDASSKPIYLSLVDQSKISGIGNYLRAEICGASNIDPFMQLQLTTPKQRKTLYETIHQIAHDCYKRGGAGDYRDIFGHQGTYSFNYYKQSVDPSGNPIKILVDSDKRKFYYI